MATIGALSWLEEGPFALYRWGELFEDLPSFFESFIYTIGLSIAALAFSMVLGTFLGVISTSRSKVLAGLVRIFVEIFQNTPLLIQVFFAYYALPLVGIVLSTYTVGIVCVGLYHAAYIAEVIRSGVQSIPAGQLEAAQSQGFTFWESMRYIILPQAFRIILPPLTNQVVNLIKNTSTIAIISGADIMFRANSWSSGNLHYIPAFGFAAFLYFILCFPLTQWASKLEKENKKAYTR